jgi:hypothetical protein
MYNDKRYKTDKTYNGKKFANYNYYYCPYVLISPYVYNVHMSTCPNIHMSLDPFV